MSLLLWVGIGRDWGGQQKKKKRTKGGTASEDMIGNEREGGRESLNKIKTKFMIEERRGMGGGKCTTEKLSE